MKVRVCTGQSLVCAVSSVCCCNGGGWTESNRSGRSNSIRSTLHPPLTPPSTPSSFHAGSAPPGSFTLTGINPKDTTTSTTISTTSTSTSTTSTTTTSTTSTLQPFQGSMDLSKLTIVGHSCGGGTAALAASRHPEFAVAVALDPWCGAEGGKGGCWACEGAVESAFRTELQRRVG